MKIVIKFKSNADKKKCLYTKLDNIFAMHFVNWALMLNHQDHHHHHHYYYCNNI